MIKLVVTDIDGTLIKKNQTLSDYTVDTIKRVYEKGILFGLASGRSVESMMALSKDWKIHAYLSFVAGMNGGAIYDVKNNQRQDYFLLDGKCCIEIMNVYKDMDVLFWILDGHIRYTNRSDEATRKDAAIYKEEEREVDMFAFVKDRQVNKLIIHCHPEDMEEIKSRAKRIKNDAYVGFSTASNLFEFVDPRINKGTGLEKICEHFTIDLDEVIAFGDELNDVEMLKKAGIGVCMQNGLDEVKAISDYVSPYTNEEDALAKYINAYILKEE
ncbi:MAG: HAD family phosphatase [Holdemanella sp.]|nr:HAD family phosphatase [Holdemanella sp.]